MSSAREAFPPASRTAAECTRLMCRSTRSRKARSEPCLAYDSSNWLSLSIFVHRVNVRRRQESHEHYDELIAPGSGDPGLSIGARTARPREQIEMHVRSLNLAPGISFRADKLSALLPRCFPPERARVSDMAISCE